MNAPNCPSCGSPGEFVTGKDAEPMPEGHAHWRCTECGINSGFDLSALKEAPVPKPKLPFTNCYACAHSGMEPDDERLICGHPDSGDFGKYLALGPDPKPLPHCKGEKFEQHPSRNRNGSLKTG